MAELTEPQTRALDLLALNVLRRVPNGWVTPDGDWVALPCMKALRRKGFAIRSRDLLRVRLTEAGRMAIATVDGGVE